MFFCRRLCSEIHVFQLWSAVAQLSLRLHRHLTAQNKRLELLYKLVSLTFNVKHHIKRLEVFFRRNRYFLHSPHPATLASLSLKLWRHVLHPNKASGRLLRIYRHFTQRGFMIFVDHKVNNIRKLKFYSYKRQETFRD